jgi:hypothetical protein
MTKLLLSSLIILGVTLSAQAEEWILFPKDKQNSNQNYGVALIGGSADLDGHASSGNLYGVEFSLVCPLVQASEHTIRQNISLTKFDKKSFDMYSLEVNPHYLFQVEESTYLGIGPSLGLSKIEGDDIVTTFGIGASIRTDLTEKLFIGAEFRKVYATDSNFANVRFIGKVGYFFK